MDALKGTPTLIQLLLGYSWTGQRVQEKKKHQRCQSVVLIPGVWGLVLLVSQLVSVNADDSQIGWLED